MKHPLEKTIKVIGWTIGAVLFGLLLVPRAFNLFSATTSQMNEWVYAGFVICLILIGAFAWTRMMKHWSPEKIDIAFSIGMGLVAGRGMRIFFPGLMIAESAINTILIQGLVSAVFIYGMFKLVRKMQESWEDAKRWAPLSNIYMVFVMGVAAAVVAADLSPLVAAGLLLAASIYDAIAVWKTKHMVDLAQYFVDRRAIPGLAVPYDDEEGRFAMLGGGDVFFIILVAATFYKVDPITMWVTALTMTSSIVLLFFLSREKTFYPALPFIFGGLLLGLGLRMVMPV